MEIQFGLVPTDSSGKKRRLRTLVKAQCGNRCVYVGGCQNYGPCLGTLDIRCRIILGTQKGTIILTTTHIYIGIHFRSSRNEKNAEGATKRDIVSPQPNGRGGHGASSGAGQTVKH